MLTSGNEKQNAYVSGRLKPLPYLCSKLKDPCAGSDDIIADARNLPRTIGERRSQKVGTVLEADTHWAALHLEAHQLLPFTEPENCRAASR